MIKPNILFFARGYQAAFFPKLVSDRYEAIFVTMTLAEAAQVRSIGGTVAACFEQDFAGIAAANVPENYLYTSFMADRFLGRFSTEQRLEILGKEIGFWARLLDEYRPVSVVNELVALEISEVLLIEARLRNIPYLAAMNCVAENYFYWMPDPMTISGRLLPKLDPSPAAIAVADDYMTALANKNYKPSYVQNLATRRALRPIAAALAKWVQWQARLLLDKLSGRFRYENYSEEYGKRLSVTLKSLWRKYDVFEDILPEREIIFYPLHQEPEATLNYMSRFCANQPSTIENILKCLTPNQVLVVKEHPVDKGSLLRRKFWELRKQYSALYFIPAEVNGRIVLERARRVVTLTSTLAWEAAAIARKVYVLGEIFYDSMPGITKIHDFNELQQVLRSSLENQQLVDQGDIKRLVASMVEFSYPCNPLPSDGLYSASNIDLVIEAICDGSGLSAGSAIAPGPALDAARS